MTTLEDLWNRMGKPFFAENALEAFKEGKSIQEIADEFDQQYVTVWAILVRFGVHIPKRRINSKSRTVWNQNRRKIQRNDLQELWEQYTLLDKNERFVFTLTELSASFCVSPSTIPRTLLRNFGDKFEEIRRERSKFANSISHKGPRIKFSREKAFSMLELGKSTEQISRFFSVHKSAVRRALRKHNPARYKELVQARIPAQKIPSNFALELYEKGSTTTKLAKRYSVTAASVSKHLKRHHGTIYKKAHPHRAAYGRRLFSWEEAHKLRCEGWPVARIASKMKVTEGAIYYALKRMK